jgi:hypothetical protein
MGELLAELDCAPRDKLWLAQHAATGIGDLMHSFVTRGIDWGKPIRISYHGA